MNGCQGCVCDPDTCPDARELAPPASWQEMVMRLANEENELGAKRQKKYGPRNIPKMGEFGLLARCMDIVERLNHCVYDPVTRDIVGGDFPDESIEDALIDLSNFARYWRAYRRGWWTVDACPPLLSPH